MIQPTWIIECRHCHRGVRVESIGYENTCPACGNVLPPIDPATQEFPKIEVVIGDNEPPVVTPDDADGIDFGNLRLGDDK